jgi:hypothetical protein
MSWTRVFVVRQWIVSSRNFDSSETRFLCVAKTTTSGIGAKNFGKTNQEMGNNDNEGLIRAAKDITAGSVGGMAQVLTGQPFDIVKVVSRQRD